MPRGRFLSRDISTSERLAALSCDSHRMLWAFCVPWLDRNGRTGASTMVLKAQTIPMLTWSCDDIDAALSDLEACRLAFLYKDSSGKLVAQFWNFAEHQRGMRANRESPSRFADPTPSQIPPWYRPTPDNSGPSPDNSGVGPDNSGAPVIAQVPTTPDLVGSTAAQVQVKGQVQVQVQEQCEAAPRARAHEEQGSGQPEHSHDPTALALEAAICADRDLSEAIADPASMAESIAGKLIAAGKVHRLDWSLAALRWVATEAAAARMSGDLMAPAKVSSLALRFASDPKQPKQSGPSSGDRAEAEHNKRKAREAELLQRIDRWERERASPEVAGAAVGELLARLKGAG